MAFDEGDWARDLLTRMDYPVTQANMTALLAWQYAEGGHFENDAHFNPLNTTKPWPGAEPIANNAPGVKAYDSYEDGMAATIASLKMPFCKDIRAALAKGNSTTDVIDAVVASAWGTTGLIYGTISRGRIALKENPDWLKPKPKPNRNPNRPPSSHRPNGPNSSHEDVVVYPRELVGMTNVLTDRNGDVEDADIAGREVWSALNFGALVDPYASLPAAALPGVDRGRLLVAAKEVGRSLDDSLGLPFVHRQLYWSTVRIDRFLTRLDEIEAEARGYRPRTRAQAMRMLKALKGKLDPAGYAAMEALLLGGLRTGRPPGRRPSSPHPRNPRPDRQTPESQRKAKIDKVLDVARREKNEKAPDEQGYNNTEYNRWYALAAGQPWCAAFVSFVFAKSGNPLPAIQGPKGFVGVPTAISWLREKGLLHSKPKVGDVFLREGSGHTGIVTAVHENGDGTYTYETIEGNAGDNTDSVVPDKHNTNERPKCHFWSPIR